MGSCFVIMGFGEKTDFQSNPQRVLNLNRTYEEHHQAGRAERTAISAFARTRSSIPPSSTSRCTTICFRRDLVIADLSTANVNAVYELGVRHALAATSDNRARGEQFQLSVRPQSSQHSRNTNTSARRSEFKRGDARQGRTEGKDHDADGQSGASTARSFCSSPRFSPPAFQGARRWRPTRLLRRPPLRRRTKNRRATPNYSPS